MVNFILLIIIAVIGALLLLLRTNALYVFFALCAGNSLVQFADKNMAYVNGHLNTHLLPSSLTISNSNIEIALLLLPPILVVTFGKHNNGPSKWPIQIFPALATAVLGVLFIVPLLSLSLQNSITQNKLWSLLEQNQILIVAACVTVCTVLLIMSTHSHSKHESKKHHKS